MAYAFRVSPPAHNVARLKQALSSHFLVSRFSLFAKTMAWSLLLCAGPLWASFTIIFNGVVTIVNTGTIVLVNPGGVAADSFGNVYISDTSNSRIIKVASGGAASILTITGISPALSSPAGIALDGTGNLYIADSGNSRIVEVAPSGSGSVILTPSITLSSPKGVVVDASGNLFIADTGNNRIVEVASGGVASLLTITGLTTALNTPLGLAVDPAGNLYIADSANSRVVRVAAGGGTGTVMGSNGVTLVTPAGLAVDSFGKLYIADTTNAQIVVVTISNGFASLINTGSLALDQPRAVAVDPSGILSIADTAANQVVSVATSSVSFGHVPLGATVGLTLTLPFTVGISATVGSVEAFTLGTQSLDFTLSAGNTCTPGTTGDVACSVDVKFLPTAPGLRRGALVIYDNSAPQVPLIIVPLFGTSDASQAAISPGQATVVSTGSVATTLPFQLALDGAGNIYSGNYTGNNVVKIPAGGGSASVVPITALSPALEDVTGVAIDGAGDLFFGDYFNSRIGIVSAGGFTSILNIFGLDPTLSLPTGIFFDGAGHLYISDHGNGRVVKITQLVVAQNSSQESSGTGAVVTPGSYTFAADSVTGVAVDPQGTVYFADRQGNRIVKVTAAGAASLVATTGVTLSNPQGVTVDGMGNLSIVDSGNNRIVQVTTAGVTSVVKFTGSTGPLGAPFGATVDPLGNLFIPDWTNNRIVKVSTSGATLVFPTTNENATSAPQTATVTNLGDDPLVFSANPTYTANFSNNSADTNPCTSATSLTPGTVCDVAVNFTPQTGGSLSANITLTNNTLNILNSTQVVAVSGTAVGVADNTSTAVSVNPSPLSNGQTVNLTATVADTVPGHAADVPTGTVSFTDTVGGTVVSLGTAVLSGGTGTKTGVLLSGIGSHTITANYAGAGATFLASSGSATVALSRAAATVTGPATQPVPVSTGQAGSAVISVAGPYNTIAAPTGTLTYNILNASGVSVLSGTLTLTAGSRSSTATIPIPSTLPAGAYNVTVSYSGDTNYLPSSAPVSIPVAVGVLTPAISWNPGAGSIPYGTGLGSILTATASSAGSAVAGTFTYTATSSGGSPFAVVAGTILPAGTYMLTATFTPTNSASYAVVHSSITLVVTKAGSAATLTSSSSTVAAGSTIVFTAAVSSAVGQPTGSVSFFDGTTLLATVGLSGATAVYSTSSLAGGAHSITATYSGDNNFAASTSSAITQTVQDFNLTLASPGGGTQTVLPGGTATYALTVGSTTGPTFPGVIDLSVSGIPPGATATITPQVLPAGSGVTPVTLTIVLGRPAVAFSGGDPLDPFLRTAAPMLLGVLVLPFAISMRRSSARLRRLACVLLLGLAGCGLMAGLAGCGSTSSGFFGQPLQSYSVTVTATSGPIAHSTTVALVVQ